MDDSHGNAIKSGTACDCVESLRKKENLLFASWLKLQMNYGEYKLNFYDYFAECEIGVK